MKKNAFPKGSAFFFLFFFIYFSSCFFCDTVEAEKKQGEMCMNQHFWKYIAGLLIFGSNGIVASHIDLNSYEIVYLRSGIGGMALVLFFSADAAGMQGTAV